MSLNLMSSSATSHSSGVGASNVLSPGGGGGGVGIVRKCVGKKSSECLQGFEHSNTRWECAFETQSEEDYKKHCKNIHKRGKWKELGTHTHTLSTHSHLFIYLFISQWRSIPNRTKRAGIVACTIALIDNTWKITFRFGVEGLLKKKN